MNKKLPMLDPRIPLWDISKLMMRNCPTCNGNDISQHWIRPDQLTVNECNFCNTFYVSPAPDDDSLNRFYDQYHDSYFASLSHKPAVRKAEKINLKHPSLQGWKLLLKMHQPLDLRLARIADFLSLNGKNVLDVGCGRGKLMDLMFSAGAIVYGVDPDPGAVDYTKARGFNNVWHGNIDAVDPLILFDLITISDVIEHPLDPLELMRKCVKRLNSAGFIMLYTPNADHVRRDPEHVMFRIHLEHMQYFSAESIEFLCKKSNLTVLHSEVHGHPYLTTIQGLNGKTSHQSRIHQYLQLILNLTVVKWPALFEKKYFRKIRGSYSLLTIAQRQG
jgi:2-polyprenyl-3-methyl-5-hydroxy-6-metoxy-1,4-benzoquinol methylase